VRININRRHEIVNPHHHRMNGKKFKEKEEWFLFEGMFETVRGKLFVILILLLCFAAISWIVRTGLMEKTF